MKESQKKAISKWNKKNTVLVPIRLNKVSDRDILYQLEMVGSKSGYIKSLIRKDIANMINTKKEILKKWNEDMAREDTMYQVELRFFKKTSAGFQECGGDPCFAMSDDLEKCEAAFEDAIYYHKNKYVTIELQMVDGVYDNNLEYDVIKRYSTID